MRLRTSLRRHDVVGTQSQPARMNAYEFLHHARKAGLHQEKICHLQALT